MAIYYILCDAFAKPRCYPQGDVNGQETNASSQCSEAQTEASSDRWWWTRPAEAEVKLVPAWVMWLLIAITAGRHYGVDVLAQAYDSVQDARQGLFYVAGGLMGVGLYVAVWRLVPTAPKSISWAVGMICAWGILEESQVAVCMIASGIDKPASAPMWRGICDSMSGLPISTITLLMPVLITAWWAQQKQGTE